MQKILALEIATQKELRGCSTEDIVLIEGAARGSLPPTYLSFMAAMGRGAGSLFRGTNIFVTDEGSNQYSDNFELLQESLGAVNSKFILDDSHFVFGQHQGYAWFFFRTDGDQDPPVMTYLEGDLEPSVSSESFSKFVALHVADAAKHLSRQKNPSVWSKFVSRYQFWRRQ